MNPTRRSLLQAFPLLPGLALAQPASAPKATVTGLEIFRVHVNQRGDWVIVRLRTSAGVTGIGDASQSGDDPRMLQFLQQLFEAIKGRSIYEIERLRGLGVAEAKRSGPPVWYLAGLKRPQPVTTNKFVTVLCDLAKRLAPLERYERRALSRRKFAIRAFDEAGFTFANRDATSSP